MAEAGLIVSRFVHFAAVLLLFGAAAFPLYAFKEGEARHRFEKFGDGFRPTLILTAAAACISALAWLGFTAANMSGSLSNAISLPILTLVVEQTDFGKVWIWRLILSVTLVILFLPKKQSDVLALLQTAGAALLLTSIAGTGHAGATPGELGTIHVAADSLHLLAASAWLGGLIPLAGVLARKDLENGAAAEILNRFSQMGILAVVALLVSGIANSVMLLESFSALTGTVYGWLLIAKVAVFLGMLHFAAQNRFKLVPALATGAGSTRENLQWNIAAEIGLGTLILAAVAVLGTLSPALN